MALSVVVRRNGLASRSYFQKVLVQHCGINIVVEKGTVPQCRSLGAAPAPGPRTRDSVLRGVRPAGRYRCLLYSVSRSMSCLPTPTPRHPHSYYSPPQILVPFLIALYSNKIIPCVSCKVRASGKVLCQRWVSDGNYQNAKCSKQNKLPFPVC